MFALTAFMICVTSLWGNPAYRQPTSDSANAGCTPAIFENESARAASDTSRVGAHTGVMRASSVESKSSAMPTASFRARENSRF